MRLAKPKQWTTAEDEHLVKLYSDEQLSPKIIAERTGRPIGSVRTRLTKLRRDGRVGPARSKGGRPTR